MHIHTHALSRNGNDYLTDENEVGSRESFTIVRHLQCALPSVFRTLRSPTGSISLFLSFRVSRSSLSHRGRNGRPEKHDRPSLELLFIIVAPSRQELYRSTFNLTPFRAVKLTYRAARIRENGSASPREIKILPAIYASIYARVKRPGRSALVPVRKSASPMYIDARIMFFFVISFFIISSLCMRV